MSNIQLYNGDCLEVMNQLIEEGVKVGGKEYLFTQEGK